MTDPIAAPATSRSRTPTLAASLLLACLATRSPASAQTYAFTYQQVTQNHQRVFGLAMGDVDGDGFKDIVSGQYVYRNPGGNMLGAWSQIRLPSGDAMIVTDVDGDAFADVIVNRTPNIEWLEATDLAGTQWALVAVVGQVPANSGFHATGQGYATAQIRPGGRPEVAFSGNTTSVYYFEIPAQNPQAGNWPRVEMTNTASEEGFALCDIDGDGLLDLVAGDMYTSQDRVAWFRNPGNGTGNWSMFRIGTAINWVDRIGGADLNGDGRRDIVISEENIGSQPDASVYWYEQPVDPTSPGWTRHLLVRQYTTNSLDLADMNGDGDIDIITGEHRGTEELTIWDNDGLGQFTKRLIDSGKESHLGARVADLDNDGDLDIVSICYDSYLFVHLWRNDSTGVPSAQVSRAGVPANPSALQPGVTNGPVVGRVWDPVVDHAVFLPGATADILLLALQPANVATPYGTLLCSTSVGSLTSIGPGSPFALPVPADARLVGASLCVQAVSIDGAQVIALTNALDITIGTY